MHRLPQLPQLSRSADVSTQSGPQSANGELQAFLHLAAAQYSPVAHFTLHPPQSLVSVLMSRQPSVQRCWFCSQGDGVVSVASVITGPASPESIAPPHAARTNHPARLQPRISPSLDPCSDDDHGRPIRRTTSCAPVPPRSTAPSQW